MTNLEPRVDFWLTIYGIILSNSSKYQFDNPEEEWAYCDGFTAYWFDDDECPYPSDSIECGYWLMGYDDAKDEIEYGDS